MKAARYVVLAGLLVIMPVKQVLAQAEQQDSTAAEASLVQKQGPQPVIRVPGLTPETPPPWRSFAEKPLEMFAEPSLSNRDAVVGWSDWSDEKKLLVVIAVGVGLLLIL